MTVMPFMTVIIYNKTGDKIMETLQIILDIKSKEILHLNDTVMQLIGELRDVKKEYEDYKAENKAS